jgi:SulP family sulfate permease
MIAIVDAYKNGLLKFNNLSSNLIAGLVVGVVALPLAMAFAIASGAQPAQGLYTAIIAAFFVGIFGGSRVQIAGPTGAFIVILAGITAHYGIVGLQLASLMAGLILLGMGILRLGNLIKFIPESVIVGFTAGIGVIIFVGEWKDFLGLPVHLPIDAHFYQKITMLIHAFSQTNPATVSIAVLSLLVLMMTPTVLKRIPGPLVAMVVATGLQMIFHFKVATLGSVYGGIPRTLPSFHLPTWKVPELEALLWPACTIAMLGAIESLLSAAAADRMAKTQHDSNQELIGQGIANIFSPLFGGFAATGAIARTATNIRNGGNSPIAAVVHSALLILIILLLSPLTYYTPLCALAAILFVVAYHMSDLPHFFHILTGAQRTDAFILIATFLLTVFTNLVIAVVAGVVLSLIVRAFKTTTDENAGADSLKIT